jgi:tripartite ATP-independent transporter DctM subunit
MSSYEIAGLSVLAMVLLIWLGMHVAVALALVSFACVWFIRGDFNTAMFHLWGAASQSVNSSVFAVVPLYVLMGSLAGAAGLGRDTYDLAHRLIGGIKGSLGVATVCANAVFAAVTGVSVASASIFAKLSVPEMIRHGYRARFAVGVVAGSSVLGMLIPPSVLMIVYGIIAEQSIGDMFIAGIGPGLLLTAAFSATILLLAYRRPGFVMAPGASDADAHREASPAHERSLASQAIPVTTLVLIVMGGIYGGIFTAIEAAAVGAAAALVIALLRKALTWRRFFDLLVDAGNVTAVVLFMIVGASMYSRMLGVSGLPTQIGNSVAHLEAGYWVLITIYVLIVLALGCLIDSVSIMLIMVPLFMVILKPFDVDLVWFGIVTIIAAEIGLLTPPFGLSVFVVHSTLARPDVTLRDVFAGSLLFAAVMLVVLIATILFPGIATGLVQLSR